MQVQALVPRIACGHPSLLSGEWLGKMVRKGGSAPSLKNPSKGIAASVNEVVPHEIQFPVKVPV